MRRIWPLLFVIACKDRETPPTPARDVVPATEAHSTNTPKPVLPAPGSDAPVVDAAPAAPPSTDEAFAAEPIDTAWRGLTEREIKHRVPKASEVECHTTQCRITITGTKQELSAAMDELQSEKSLRGIARNVLLTAPAPQPDGKMALRAYAQFER